MPRRQPTPVAFALKWVAEAVLLCLAYLLSQTILASLLDHDEASALENPDVNLIHFENCKESAYHFSCSGFVDFLTPECPHHHPLRSASVE